MFIRTQSTEHQTQHETKKNNKQTMCNIIGVLLYTNQVIIIQLNKR